MEFFKQETHINFMRLRKKTGFASLAICCLSLILIFVYKLNFGLEFTGGTQIELRFEEPIEASVVKDELEEAGLSDLRVQQYGSTKDILIRIASSVPENEHLLRNEILTTFQQDGKSVDVRRVEYVGSEVGKQLTEQGSVAVLLAILSTMVYIGIRFEYRFALSAAVALSHDAIIVLGIFALFQIEFDLATLAAVLAVLGYSLNDTIVVFDRIRENFRRIRKESTANIIDISINQTLSRTIMTSWLTLLVVLALLFFGGESLFGFSLALSIGIIVGTYSSIYVAGAMALNMGLSRTDLLPKPKPELDGLP